MRVKDFRKYYTDKPENDGYSFIDSAAAGIGRSMQTWGEIMSEALRPENVSPVDWEKQQPLSLENLRNTGKEMYERNAHEYEQGSLPYYADQLVMSMPESLAIMAGSTLLGMPVGGLLGAAGRITSALAPKIPGSAQAAMDLATAYRANNILAKTARAFTPQSTHALASAGIGAHFEALSEAQNAYDEYIANANQRGTYVEGVTEQEANQVRDNVYRDNMAIISAFNIPQYNLLLGKSGKGLFGKATGIGKSILAEGGEEASQEVASAYEQGEPQNLQRIIDAAIVGGAMGGLMQGGAYSARSIANRGKPSQEEIEEAQKTLRAENARSQGDIYRQKIDTLKQYADWDKMLQRKNESEDMLKANLRASKDFNITRDLAHATGIISDDKADRVEQGGAILRLFYSDDFRQEHKLPDLTKDLELALTKGSEKAIRAAQVMLEDSGIELAAPIDSSGTQAEQALKTNDIGKLNQLVTAAQLGSRLVNPQTQQRDDNRNVFDLLPNLDELNEVEEEENILSQSQSQTRPQAQVQQDPVTKNKTPENILPQFNDKKMLREALREKTTENPYLAFDLKRAKAPIPKERFDRSQQGVSFLRIFYSPQYQDVELPAGLEKALERGDEKALQKAKQILEQAEQTSFKTDQLAFADELQLQDNMLEDKIFNETERIFDEEQADYQKNKDNAQRQWQLNRTSENDEKALNLALDEISENKNKRKKQGKAILRILRIDEFKEENKKISAIPGLKNGLEHGSKKAINIAQSILTESQSEIAQRLEQDSFDDKLLFEDELLESKINLSEDLENLFDEREKQQVEKKNITEAKPTQADELAQQAQEKPKEEERNDFFTDTESEEDLDERSVFDLLPTTNELNDIEEETPQQPQTQAQPDEKQKEKSSDEGENSRLKTLAKSIGETADEILATPEEKKQQEELEKKFSEAEARFLEAMDIFNNGGLINMDALDRDLGDENSFIRRFLDTHDVITDKQGNLVGIKLKSTEKKEPNKPAIQKGKTQDIKNSPANNEEQEMTTNEQRESGESTRLDDGYRNVESEVRSATGETAREERRVENTGRDSGQQRQDAQESGEYATGTNAENERPVQENGAGKTSTRNGAGVGVRRNPGTVQSNEQDGRPVHDDGRGQSGIHETAKTVKHETAGHNFHITKEHGIGEGGLKTKFKQNIDVIKLLKQIESEGRMATPSEQEILSKFNGWGTIASVFSDNSEWQKEQKQLKEILTPEEYESASAAQRNAFYTSPKVAEAIWQGVTRMGFKGGRILDPSTGSGIFFGIMPVELASKSTLVGTELDKITGRIAKQLYQKADIEVTGFEERILPNNYFDLAISNVPFGNEKILKDPAYRKDAFALHDFFFAKSMDKVRPGGLVAFITSTGTLNSDVTKLYAKLDKQADLVAAFKLPSNTFDRNAGTQVTTDVVIFQKRLDPHKRAEYAKEWDSTQYRDYDIGGIRSWFRLNRYFVEHPEHMLGEPIEDTLYPRGRRLALDGKGRDVVRELSNLMNKLPENIFVPIKNAVPIPNKIVLTAPPTQQDGTFTAQDGKIFQKQGEKLVEITGKNVAPARDYIHLLGTLDALLKAQLDPTTTEEKVSELRKLLNQKYDDFVKKHGYINSPTNARRFIADPNYGRLAAIENYKPAKKKGEKESVSKVAIFSKRTVEPNKIPSSADTAVDALSLSLAMRGQVDMDYISDLTGKNEPEIVKELGDLIYRNPATNLHELSEEYLSGNVREKLAEAKEAARTNPEFKRNVTALEKVQPADLTEHDISPHLGAPWISHEYYEAFIKQMLNHNVYDVAVNYSAITGEWTVEGRSSYDSEHYKWQVPGTKWNFLSLLEAAMNKKSPTVTKDKKIDEVKTNEAREKIAQLKEEFKKWIWTDEARKKDLLETYNVEFNSEILRDYESGASLAFPGLAQDVKEKLYPHQRNVIWRILQGKNTLIAHTVGAGKTWSMQIAAMEMKRLGIIKKPLFVVPTNILKQFEREFRAAYPSANLLTLAAADLVAPKVNVSFDEKLDTTGRSKTPKSAVKGEKKESLYQRQERLLARRKALSKIATGDWDGIIISHDMFLRLPMSPETYNEFYREQKALLQEEKRNQYGDKAGDKKHTKLLENAIASLEQKLARDINEEKKEIVMPFEELGIDQIFVDEADMFKNLGFNTHYNSSRGERVSGISTTNAQRSLDMYIKTKWLSKIRNGGGVVFATGTPISNTLNEIYTMQRYLDYFMLQDKKIYQFDNWAGMFAEEVKSIEADPSGNGFREVTRLKLTNLQTLIRMFRKFADIKMAEDLPHLTRPKLKNDSRTVVQIEPTNAFQDFKKEILVRATAIHDGKIDPSEDNFLKITLDFRKASLDMRLIDPSISESEAGGKIDAICSSVATKYKETTNIKGAQLIFSDLSVPKPKKENKDNEEISDEEAALEEETTLDDISVYERIKKGLIKRGVPANQIAFVHEAKNANQRQALFDRVNNGDVRVIIGSTSKMGAGTNFQKHLVALHHLDCPWRPRDIEQREGRILRSGNDNEEVEIFTYVTKGSYDANMWEKLAIKQAMFDSVLRGDPNIKELDDISEIAAGYEDIAAIIYENPLMSEEAKLSAQLQRLRYSKNLFAQQQRQKNSEQKSLAKQIPQIERQIADLNADIALKIDTKGDAFKMKLGGTTYTKRAEAAKAFDELIQNFSKESSTKVGEIGGFDIKMRAEHTMASRGGVLETISTRVFVQLANNGVYSAEDSLKSIEHFISHGGIETAREYAEKNLKATKAKLDAVNEELAKPFSKQSELDDTEKRLQEVRAQISGAQNNSTESETPTEQAESEEEFTPKKLSDWEKDDWFKRHVIIARVLDDESKSSKQGKDVDTEIKNYVDQKDLTSQQKLLQDFGRKLGVRVIFFKGDSRFHGQHSNGITYLNVDSNMPLGKVFWHESMHWLKNNNPKLYQQLVKAAGITDEQRQAYLERTGRNDLGTDAAIDEEIISDQFEDVAKRSGLLQSIAGKNRSLIQRVIQWLQDTMKKFIEHFRKPQGKFTTAQSQALADEFWKIAKELVDPNGEQIFRYNRRTHNVELADGRDWNSVEELSDNRGVFDLQPKYSIGTSDKKVKSWFSGIAKKFADKLDISGEGIITPEDVKQARRKEQEKAMDAYLENPSEENKAELKRLGISNARLEAYSNGEEFNTDIRLRDIIRSPSHIADKNAVFRPFYEMGEKSMKKLVRLRDDFSRHFGKAYDLVKDKEDKEQLAEIILTGDMEGKEFTKQELLDDGVKENVAEAYLQIRRQLNRAYTLIDDARRHPNKHAQHLSDRDIEKLRQNKFVKHLHVTKDKDTNGKSLVVWTEYQNEQKEYTIDAATLEQFKKNAAIQILSEQKIADDKYKVKVLEGKAPLTKIGGYFPHVFHEFRVVIKNSEGKMVGEIIGSGKTQRDAVKIAKEWLKNNELKDGENIYISPQIFDAEKILGMSNNFAPVMGDTDYGTMTSKIAKKHDMRLKEAEEFVDGAVRLKNRKRFFGHLMKREGYEGYDKDVESILGRYFNMTARYVALQTEFKPKAITLFERIFGAFDKDWSKNTLAQYTKNYISDVNGDPSWLETIIEEAFASNPIWNKAVMPFVGGERSVMRATNSITSRIAYLKLGMGNISSALLNLTQLINAAGYVGWENLAKPLKSVVERKGNLTQSELLILSKAGVLQDIGLDTGTGYDRNRNYYSRVPILRQLDWVGNKSMILFQKCDSLCRVATTLAAYEKALAEGKTKAQAIEYAKTINRKANFSYGVEDAPNIFRRLNPIGKLGLQFMKYPFKQMGVLMDFVTPKTTWKQKAAFWIPYILICGLSGFPALDWLDELLSEKFNLFPKDNIQKFIIKGSKEIFGETLGKQVAKIAIYGAPSVANVDISKRAGLSGMVPEDLFGATGSTVGGFLVNAFRGDGENTLRSLSPGLANIYSATIGETHDRRGRKLSDYENIYERLIHALGFKTFEESATADAYRINFDERSEKVREDQKAIDDYIRDPSPENLKRLKERKITPKRVKEERKKKKFDKRGRLQENMTKEESRRNKYLLEFAQ